MAARRRELVSVDVEREVTLGVLEESLANQFQTFRVIFGARLARRDLVRLWRVCEYVSLLRRPLTPFSR